MLMSSREGMVGEHTFRWLDSHPKGRVAACDKCHKRVWPDQPRMQVHDGKGRFDNKGTASSYWCSECAGKEGIHPPIPEHLGTQEGLW